MLRSILITLTAHGLAAASGANADAHEEVLRDAVTACRAIPGAEARLDCYDDIALGDARSVIDAAPAAEAAAPSIESEVAPAADEAEFGLEMALKEAPDSMVSSVVEVRRNALGGLVVTLANQQVWQQTDSRTLSLKPGDSVTLYRGALTAFYLAKDGKGRRYRFTRIE